VIEGVLPFARSFAHKSKREGGLLFLLSEGLRRTQKQEKTKEKNKIFLIFQLSLDYIFIQCKNTNYKASGYWRVVVEGLFILQLLTPKIKNFPADCPIFQIFTVI
jgi:hypothetical protein